MGKKVNPKCPPTYNQIRNVDIVVQFLLLFVTGFSHPKMNIPTPMLL